MLLLNVGNRGLNLWCVERAFLSVASGVKTYTTAPGTLDVLNVVYSKPTLVAGTFLATATGGETALSVASPAVRVGVKFASGYTGALTLSASTDGLVFEANTSVPSATYVAGQYYWFALNSVSTNLSIAVDGPVAVYPVLSDIIVASAVYDLPLTQWNRDTYAAINAKDQSGSPSTSYFYEKKLTPTITLWPVPNNSTDHLTLYQHRQPHFDQVLTIHRGAHIAVQSGRPATAVETERVPPGCCRLVVHQLPMRAGVLRFRLARSKP